MQRIAIRAYGDTEWTAFPINPLEFASQDNLDYNQSQTLDGRSIEQYAQFDGRPRTFTWKGLPNKSPYKAFIATMRGWQRNGIYELKLGDVSGTASDTTIQYIKVLTLNLELRPGAGPETAESHLVYDTVQLVYVRTVPST